MKMEIFAVYDEKAAAYMTPFFMNSRGEASRAFGDAVSSPDHAFHKHAEDFTLYYLGTFDNGLAQFETVTPEPLVRASSLLVKVTPIKREA